MSAASKIADRPAAQPAADDHGTRGGVAGLRSRIASLIAKGSTPHDAADAAIEAASIDELRVFCRAHARWEAKRILRDRTRSREDEVRAAMKLGTSVEEATRILDPQLIALPDGRIVAFEDMTIDEHQERSAWLSGQAKGLMQTSKLHTQVASLLANEKVACVRELRAAPMKRVREMLAEVAA